jgi:hypothetical protein
LSIEIQLPTVTNYMVALPTQMRTKSIKYATIVCKKKTHILCQSSFSLILKRKYHRNFSDGNSQHAGFMISTNLPENNCEWVSTIQTEQYPKSLYFCCDRCSCILRWYRIGVPSTQLPKRSSQHNQPVLHELDSSFSRAYFARSPKLRLVLFQSPRTHCQPIRVPVLR